MQLVLVVLCPGLSWQEHKAYSSLVPVSVAEVKKAWIQFAASRRYVVHRDACGYFWLCHVVMLTEQWENMSL
jgi:hypothetical protein